MAKNIIEVVTKNLENAKKSLDELNKLERQTTKDGKIQIVAEVNDTAVQKAKGNINNLIASNKELRSQMQGLSKDSEAYKKLSSMYNQQAKSIRELKTILKESNNEALKGIEEQISGEQKLQNQIQAATRARKQNLQAEKTAAKERAQAEKEAQQIIDESKRASQQQEKSDLATLKTLNNERVSLEKKLLQSENNISAAKKVTNKELDYTKARLEEIARLTREIQARNIGNESIEKELVYGDNRVAYQQVNVPQKADYQELINLTKQYYEYEKQLIKLKSDPKAIKNHQEEIAAIEQEMQKTKELMDIRLKSNRDGTSLTDDQINGQKRLANELETNNKLYQAQRKDIANAKNATSELGDTIKKVFNYVLVYKGFQLLTQGIQQAIDTMKDLDKAFTDIQMVTGDTDEATAELAQNYNALAKEMGSTTQEVAEGASEWFNESRDHLKTLELLETRED